MSLGASMRKKKTALPGQPVDMNMIAKHLGVSRTTVHYALFQTGRVSESTRLKVLKLASEMGYRPNLLARSLRTKKTQTIGVLLSSSQSSFYAHLLEAIDRTAQESGYNILLACSYRDAEKERDLLEIMVSRGVDGIIAAPTFDGRNGPDYDALARDHVPIVFVDRNLPNSHIDYVSVDNALGGKLAGEHLLSQGRRRLAFLTMVHSGRQSSTLQERLDGFNQGLSEAGLQLATVLGLKGVKEMSGEAFGYATIAEELRKKSFSLDGLFAANDNLAIGAMHALREVGKEIPKEISIVGFDDQDASAYLVPPLTTIRQPVDRVGVTAVELLLKNMEQDGVAKKRKPALIKLAPTFVARESS